MPVPLSRSRTRPWRLLATLVVPALMITLLPAVSVAQSTTVTGLTVHQEHGWATLAWDPVPGATQYQIERTPIEGTEGDTPSGPGVIIGLWRTDRTAQTDNPTFADSGFVPGDRYQWRVRAVGQEYSDPVIDNTVPAWGPEEFTTNWERTLGSTYTSYSENLALQYALAEESDRVRLVNLGESVQGREVNMLVFGYPEPVATAEEIKEDNAVLLQCHVHGTERAGWEACPILARRLAFSDDPWTLDVLSHSTVLMVPSINPDGHVNGTRGNATGQDLNRDHSQIRQPETLALAEALRDYKPEIVVDGHELGNSTASDLPLMWPRVINAAEDVYWEARHAVRTWMFTTGEDEGWWVGPYPIEGAGETLLHHLSGLKNMVGILLESRVQAGATRPNAGGSSSAANLRRRSYSHLWTYQQAINYHRGHLDQIQTALTAGEEHQRQNIGPAYLAGARGEENPPPQPVIPQPHQIIDPGPCGYGLTSAQYSGPRPDGRPAADRLEAHGVTVYDWDGGVLVPMNQALRGLLPYVLDPSASNQIVGGTRLFECPALSDAGGPYLATGGPPRTIPPRGPTFRAQLDAGRSIEPHGGAISYSWSIVSGSGDFDDPSSATPVFYPTFSPAFAEGELTMTLELETCNDVGCTTSTTTVTKE